MQDNVVILGVTKTTALIFDEEFPELKKVEIVPYAISYSKHVPLALKLLLDSCRILNVIKKEKQQLQEFVKAYGIEIVISDNRFGLSCPGVENIYITHQLNLQAGLLSGIANAIHRHYINQFNRLWVPDYEEREALAGKLSARGKLNHAEYLGPLSRLTSPAVPVESFDYLCLLSGPEPQRSILENRLLKNAAGNKAIVLVRGSQQKVEVPVPGNLRMIDLPDAKQLAQLVQAAGTVVCRSGYSTLMDLHVLQKKELVLIPTPGQSEQLYLATYWNEKFGAKVLDQDQLDQFRF